MRNKVVKERKKASKSNATAMLDSRNHFKPCNPGISQEDIPEGKRHHVFSVREADIASGLSNGRGYAISTCTDLEQRTSANAASLAFRANFHCHPLKKKRGGRGQSPRLSIEIQYSGLLLLSLLTFKIEVADFNVSLLFLLMNATFE